MNLRNAPSVYLLELNAKELTLVAKALALLGGLEVRVRNAEEAIQARELNIAVLQARHGALKSETKTVQDALNKAVVEQPLRDDVASDSPA